MFTKKPVIWFTLTYFIKTIIYINNCGKGQILTLYPNVRGLSGRKKVSAIPNGLSGSLSSMAIAATTDHNIKGDLHCHFNFAYFKRKQSQLYLRKS